MSESINISAQDLDVPYIFPFTGSLVEQQFDSILSILLNKEFNEKDDVLEKLKRIRNFMDKEKFAVIGNRTRNGIRIDLSKRICNRRTIKGEVVDELGKVIIPKILSTSKFLPIKPDDIKLDNSHCDILYYGYGGKFSLHRDTELEFPFGENPIGKNGHKMWRMYTVLVGLDSNVNKFNSSSGSTVIYLPNSVYSQEVKDKLLEKFPNSWFALNNKLLNKHTFSESISKSRFMVFPSNCLHSSIEINEYHYYKLVLKMDVWIKLPDISYEERIDILRINGNFCNCRECNPNKENVIGYYHMLREMYFKKNKLTYYLWYEIIIFIIGDTVPNQKLLCKCNFTQYSPCACSCYKCLYNENCHYYPEDEYSDEDIYDRYDDCNGYDEDY